MTYNSNENINKQVDNDFNIRNNISLNPSINSSINSSSIHSKNSFNQNELKLNHSILLPKRNLIVHQEIESQLPENQFFNVHSNEEISDTINPLLNKTLSNVNKEYKENKKNIENDSDSFINEYEQFLNNFHKNMKKIGSNVRMDPILIAKNCNLTFEDSNIHSDVEDEEEFNVLPKKLKNEFGELHHVYPEQVELLFNSENSFLSITKVFLDEKGISEIRCLDLFTNITHLYLQGNNIKELPIDQFEFLNHLQLLALSDNKIKKIENINHLEKLYFLDLSNNKISQCEMSEFPPNLRICNITGNPIDNLDFFNGLIQHLQYIMSLNDKPITVEYRTSLGLDVSNEYIEEFEEICESLFPEFISNMKSNTNEIINNRNNSSEFSTIANKNINISHYTNPSNKPIQNEVFHSDSNIDQVSQIKNIQSDSNIDQASQIKNIVIPSSKTSHKIIVPVKREHSNENIQRENKFVQQNLLNQKTHSKNTSNGIKINIPSKEKNSEKNLIQTIDKEISQSNNETSNTIQKERSPDQNVLEDSLILNKEQKEIKGTQNLIKLVSNKDENLSELEIESKYSSSPNEKISRNIMLDENTYQKNRKEILNSFDKIINDISNTKHSDLESLSESANQSIQQSIESRMLNQKKRFENLRKEYMEKKVSKPLRSTKSSLKIVSGLDYQFK